MKRLLTIAFVVIAATTTVCAAPQKDRLNAIWTIAQERLNKQNDYWFEEGDFPRCIQTLRLMATVYPADYEVATNLGWLLESTEENEEALAVYIRYGKDNPGDPDAQYPEANFYYMKKAFSRVPAIIEPTLKSKPHPNSFRILAHSYERMGMLMDSKRIWDALLAMTPADEAAKRNRERVENKMKGNFPPSAPKR